MKLARQAVPDKSSRRVDHPKLVATNTTTPVTPTIKMPRTDRRFADWRSLYHSDVHRGRGAV